MYEEFFGLDRRPFSFQPDATCIHWTNGHQSAFATLQAGIERQCPITLVTGEVGCGKTTLIRHLLETAPVDLTIGLVSNFVSGRGSVLEWALMAFDQNFEGESAPELLKRFQEFTIAEYAAGRRTALIVDEAQNISPEDLESLRLLSNVNADDDVLLLMFLVGQPELRERLADPKFRQIVQRIGSDFHLNALTEEETAGYIRFLLEQAGSREEVFDAEALSVIFGVTAGIPRKINLLADLCMVFAFAEDRRTIDAGFVRKILGDFGERGIFASLTAPSAEKPPEELDESQDSTPIEHVAWAPKVVGLNGPLAPGTDTLLPVSVTTGRRGAEPATEPAARPGRDDPGEEDAVSPPENAEPSPEPEPETETQPEPEATGTVTSTAVADEELAETTVAQPPLESDLPERKAAGSGWHRYLLGAAAVLVIAIGGAYVGLKPEQTPSPEATDSASPQIAGVAVPATLSEVRAPGESGGPAIVAEALRSETTNRPAGSGALARLQAQVGEVPAAPPETIPAEVARPVPASRTLAMTFLAEATDADPGSTTAAHRLAALAEIVPGSVPPELRPVVPASGPVLEAKPSPSGPVIGHPVNPPAEPILLATSFVGWNRPAPKAVAVVRDAGLHQSGPGVHEPAGLLETPPGAGRVAWREASTLALEATGIDDRKTGAGFGADASLGSRAQIAPLRLAALEAPGNRLGRAKQSVRLIPNGDALMLLSALDPQERPVPGQVPAEEGSQLVNGGDTAGLSGRALFKQALTLSPDDPTGAAVLYTRAALRGHKRSAYYLGQIYETGDGVPVDFSLARAWYSAAGPDDSRAQRRIRALPEPSNQRAALSAPTPLWADTTPGVTSEFVWTSGKGGDAAFFFVQVTGNDSRVPDATFRSERSGAFLELPPSAAFWRVLAVDPASAQYAASEWVEVGQPGHAPAPAGAASSGTDVVPSAVIAHAPGSAAARVAEMSDALASMKIPARTVASREVAGTGDRIYFFYDQDRAAAEALAELISADAANAVSKAAPSHDGRLALPGEILVTLGDPRS